MASSGVSAARQTEELGNLATDDDQPDAGEIAADHRKGNVLDQAADAHETEGQLHHPGDQTKGRQHEDDRWRRGATLNEFDRKGREHRRSRRARRRNQSIGATQGRGHQAESGRPENSGQRAEAGVGRADGRIDGDTESDRRWQRHQHRRQPPPEVTDQLVILERHGQFHRFRSSFSLSRKILRGILSTLYGTLRDGIHLADVQAAYQDYHRANSFVRLYDSKAAIGTAHVRGTNYCNLTIDVDERTRRLRVVAHIDNLMKGQASNALQNMNIICGLPEDTGLHFPGAYP